MQRPDVTIIIIICMQFPTGENILYESNCRKYLLRNLRGHDHQRLTKLLASRNNEHVNSGQYGTCILHSPSESFYLDGNSVSLVIGKRMQVVRLGNLRRTVYVLINSTGISTVSHQNIRGCGHKFTSVLVVQGHSISPAVALPISRIM